MSIDDRLLCNVGSEQCGRMMTKIVPRRGSSHMDTLISEGQLMIRLTMWLTDTLQLRSGALTCPSMETAISLDQMLVDVLAEFGRRPRDRPIFVNYHYRWLTSAQSKQEEERNQEATQEGSNNQTHTGSVSLKCGISLRFLEPASFTAWVE